MNQHTNQLNEFVDMIVAYKLIKILTTNFEDTDAFKLGVIDKDGKILKKRKDLRGEERAAYTIFHTLIWNLKKLMLKIPGLKSKLGSYAAALFLLKEAYNQEHGKDGELVVQELIEHLKQNGITEGVDSLFENTFNNKLSEGVYITVQEIVTPSFNIINEGETILIGQDKTPFVEFANTPLYTAVHMESGEEIIVDSSSVEKIHEDIETAPEMVAGMAVFDVKDVPHDMVHGHQSYERWGKDKFSSIDDGLKGAIRKWSYRNKGKTVALRDSNGLISKFRNVERK